MAFTPGSIANQYSGTAPRSTGGFVPGSISSRSTRPIGQSSAFTPGSISSQFRSTSTKDLGSSQGLYNLAVQNGLKNRADAILGAQAGEQTKKIFSGGFISDTFDALNALNYGVVGLIKGKSFAEGVKTRASFSDKDSLGSRGLLGVIAGTLLDIAVDPFTYIAPWTVIKKIPFATKLLKGAEELAFGKRVTKAIEGTDKTFETVEGGTKLGKYLASKLVYMQAADPTFRNIFERSVKNIAVTTQKVSELGKMVAKLAPETASKLLVKDSTGRFARASLPDLQKVLKPNELEPVSQLYSYIDNLGKEAVDLGLLSKAKYEENLGQYLKNAYTEYETAKGKGLFGAVKTGIKGIKSRVQDLSPEKMKELGQIDNPAYLLFKSAFDLTKDVENANLFKKVGDNFGTDVAQEGFVKMPGGTKYGKIADKYVPEHMAEYLKEIVPVSEAGDLEKFGKNLVANFKFFKVVMNPGTHARNIISNKILNYWKLGMNPLDPRVLKNDLEAGREILKGTGKWIEEARPHGYNLDTFASAEMKNLLNSPEASAWGKTEGAWNTVKKKLGDLYQSEENHAKLSAYIWNRKKGFSPEEAWKAAESATFNYAQVTPFIRKLRESLFGFPFITFTVKSTPLAIETILKNPQRVSVLGKIKQNIENLADIKETERERASEPSWVRNGFYIKLPIKDKHGRSSYFDLTYILPFGDIMSGNFFERGQNLQTGLPESQASSVLKKSPFIQIVGDLYRNKNFYGNKIWKDSDPSEKQLKDLMVYLTKTIAPPPVADQLHNGYNEKGEKQRAGFVGATGASEENQKRTITQELLRNVGAKIQPIDADIQETYQEWNKKKALQNLLLENGVLSNFTNTYIPKKKI